MNDRLAFSFPTIGQIRKGTEKVQYIDDKGKPAERMGADLDDKFRVHFFTGANNIPGIGDAVATFLNFYKTLTPKFISAVVPCMRAADALRQYNEAYSAGRLVAQATDWHYITLRDPVTWRYLVRDGVQLDPEGHPMGGDKVKTWTPQDVITYERDGRQFNLKFKRTSYLKLVLPVFRRLVLFELRSTSYYDSLNLQGQIAGVQEIANVLNNGNCGGIPLVLYRRLTMISKTIKGKAVRDPSWLINVEVEPDYVAGVFDRFNQIAGGNVHPMLQAAIQAPELDVPESGTIYEDEGEEELTADQVLEAARAFVLPGGKTMGSLTHANQLKAIINSRTNPEDMRDAAQVCLDAL